MLVTKVMIQSTPVMVPSLRRGISLVDPTPKTAPGRTLTLPTPLGRTYGPPGATGARSNAAEREPLGPPRRGSGAGAGRRYRPAEARWIFRRGADLRRRRPESRRRVRPTTS